jgi:hypothetical protein
LKIFYKKENSHIKTNQRIFSKSKKIQVSIVSNFRILTTLLFPNKHLLETYKTLEEKNKIQGYCLGRQGYNYVHIGPVVANNIDIAKNLVGAALQNSIGLPVILDVLHFDTGWLKWLAAIGFAEQRLFTRMYRGTNAFHAEPEKQYAILGPEFG